MITIENQSTKQFFHKILYYPASILNSGRRHDDGTWSYKGGYLLQDVKSKLPFSVYGDGSTVSITYVQDPRQKELPRWWLIL